MILPHVRASFGRTEADLVLNLFAAGDEVTRASADQRMRRQGIDALLDDPRTFNAFMVSDDIGAASPRLAFYLLVRHALLEHDIDDRTLADYLAAVLLEFGRGTRAFEPDDHDGDRLVYLVDIVQAAESASGRRAFMLHVHLGNYALWLSGLFPDRITGRVERRGAPGMKYYEELGATGYRRAAGSSDAEAHGLNDIYRTCADGFPALRVALNRIADRHLFPTAGDPVDRLLRQVADDFRTRSEAE